MTQKLMLLGGSQYLEPVIVEAHKLGFTVITCDYLPDNYAHRLSDEYSNISIVDEDAVLEEARRLHIDGIMSFACDPGVVSAAYVAEALALPTPGPFESICTLQNKTVFRSFQRAHHFACPQIVSCTDVHEGLRQCQANMAFPLIVKPDNLSGSKGVTLVDNSTELETSLRRALNLSRNGKCVIEELVHCAHVIETDAIVLDGVVSVPVVQEQSFDNDAPNPYVPIATTVMGRELDFIRIPLENEIQHLANLLELTNGILNVEARVKHSGEIVLMEVSPRGGGGDVALLSQYAGGPNIIRAAVNLAVGLEGEIEIAHEQDGSYWRHEGIHSRKAGTFLGMGYASHFKRKHVVRESIWTRPKEQVRPLLSASDIFGTAVLHFDTRQEFDQYMDSPASFFHAEVN